MIATSIVVVLALAVIVAVYGYSAIRGVVLSPFWPLWRRPPTSGEPAEEGASIPEGEPVAFIWEWESRRAA